MHFRALPTSIPYTFTCNFGPRKRVTIIIYSGNSPEKRVLLDGTFPNPFGIRGCPGVQLDRLNISRPPGPHGILLASKVLTATHTAQTMPVGERGWVMGGVKRTRMDLLINYY